MLRRVIESRIEKCWMLSLPGGTSRSPRPFADAVAAGPSAPSTPSPATASEPAAAVPRKRLAAQPLRLGHFILLLPLRALIVHGYGWPTPRPDELGPVQVEQVVAG